MIDCVRTGLAAFILWRMNPASTKEDTRSSKKQVELDGDNEARSGKQGGGSRRALIRAVFGRLRFQNLHDERLLEAQVEKDNFHQFKNSDFSQGEGNGRFSQMAFSACGGRPAARNR
ncbi:MAG: hypothetical protein ABSE57_00025 [Bryobacteraceae bacterium]|jgi:hypothetical protein